MNTNELLDEILIMLRTFEDDQERLEKLHQYIKNELYVEEVESASSEVIPVPEKFASLVKSTADNLSAGFVCYVNPDTLEEMIIPESILESMIFDFEDDDDEDEKDEKDEEDLEGFADDENLFYADMKRVYTVWKEKITITPPESTESFTFMEGFVESVSNGHLKNMLSDALSGRKPFRHFNNIIHQSDGREAWFAFRQKCLENYVAEILALKLWNDESDD